MVEKPLDRPVEQKSFKREFAEWQLQLEIPNSLSSVNILNVIVS